LEQLQHIYNEIKDENEIAIIEKYGSNAKRYTVRIIRKIKFIDFLYVSRSEKKLQSSLIKIK